MFPTRPACYSLFALLALLLAACGGEPEEIPLDVESLRPTRINGGRSEPETRPEERPAPAPAVPPTEGAELPRVEPKPLKPEADDPQVAETLAASVAESLKGLLSSLEQLLADNLTNDVLRREIEDVRGRTIDRLVELGHARERLSDEQRKRVKTLADKAIAELRDAQVHLRGAVERLKEDEAEFASLIAGDVPGLAVYAYFELLKAQKPEEAERLGIR